MNFEIEEAQLNLAELDTQTFFQVIPLLFSTGIAPLLCPHLSTGLLVHRKRSIAVRGNC